LADDGRWIAFAGSYRTVRVRVNELAPVWAIDNHLSSVLSKKPALCES
jgi:hypothetical protein